MYRASPRASEMGVMQKKDVDVDAWAGRKGPALLLPAETQTQTQFGSKKRSRLLTMLSSAALLVFGSAYLFSCLTGAIPLEHRSTGTESHNGRQRGHIGAVASEQSVCSGIGADMLSGGGNAADAVSHNPYFMSQC